MKLYSATLVERMIAPDWPLVADDVPLGKEYIVDVDRLKMQYIVNIKDGRSVKLGCVWVVSPGPGGWLPGRAFGMKFRGDEI